MTKEIRDALEAERRFRILYYVLSARNISAELRDFGMPNSANTFSKLLCINAVPIPQQITRLATSGERLNDLFTSPVSGRIFCHIKMDYSPTIMSHNDQDKQSPINELD